ncbi:MAG: SGNH/GDSL hydrolase family protein [Halioglobus sp.]|nr:SGNH/GDSL hydrolase family protein [Halioglobus sp.]
MQKECIQNAAILAGSLLVSLILAELIIRLVAGAPLPEKLPMVMVIPDPNIGWMMKPHDQHFTYDIPVKLNALGFRGPEVAEKQPGEYRILAIGDSNIYGQALPDEQILTTVWQDKLDSTQDDCKYTVVNMAARAWSTNQQLPLLQTLGLELKPDHIVLFFYVNDFKAVNIERRYKNYKDYGEYMFDIGQPMTPAIMRKWNFRQILRQSALIMWTYDLIRGLQGGDTMEAQILYGDLSDEARGAIAETIGYLEQFAATAAANNLPFTLALIPASPELRESIVTADYKAPLRTHFAGRDDVELIDLLPSLRALYEEIQDTPLIPFDGHYDARANEAMAEALVDTAIRCD